MYESLADSALAKQCIGYFLQIDPTLGRVLDNLKVGYLYLVKYYQNKCYSAVCASLLPC